FQFSADAILQSVSKGFSDGITASVQPSQHCFDAVVLIHPNVHIIAALMRGIHNQVACKVKYVSLSSGEGERVIVPHAIINNGHRWHVRAFDVKSSSFRDFVCTRFTMVDTTTQLALSNQKAVNDDQFNRLVSLVLMVHPNIAHKQAVEMDYAMQNGEKIMQVRAALAAYILRHWQVDCSFEHRIVNQGCQLALKNHEVLANIDNPQLAPGFVGRK
ncbi:MAG: WYL domain-containing protein, partial [Glaciecola sp.]